MRTRICDHRGTGRVGRSGRWGRPARPGRTLGGHQATPRMNPQEPPVSVGDVVIVQLTESAFGGFGEGGVAEPGIVALVPGVPQYGSTQVRIHGISYEVSSPMMDAFGYGVPIGLPVRDCHL